MLPDGTTFEMVKVVGGSFLMEIYPESDKEQEVEVLDFWMGKYPVTQELWQAVMGNNPAHFKGGLRPVEQISLDEIFAFLQKLNNLSGQNYRLPNLVEWEFAATGGKNNRDFRFSGSNKLKEVGWYSQNSHGETKPVGLKRPNQLGLFDMSGNIREICGFYNQENPKIGEKEIIKNSDDSYESRFIPVRGGAWDLPDFQSIVFASGIFHSSFQNRNVGFRLAKY